HHHRRAVEAGGIITGELDALRQGYAREEATVLAGCAQLLGRLRKRTPHAHGVAVAAEDEGANSSHGAIANNSDLLGHIRASYRSAAACCKAATITSPAA